MTRRNSSDYKALQPYIVEEIRRVVGGGGTRTTTGGGGLEAHALSNTSLHTGTLADSQAPQFLKTDGSRALTGNLAVSAGVTIDGVDISEIDIHPRLHDILSTDDHTVAGNAGQVVGLTAADTLGLLGPGAALSFADAAWNVITGAGLEIASNAVALKAPGTLSVATANSAANNHTHAVTSSADPDATASLLATTAAGLLSLRNLALRQAAQSYATFASGFAGSGWRVDYGITAANRASAEFDDLTVRGRMRVYELLIQQIRATNGSLFVTSGSKTVTVTQDSNAWMVNGEQLTFNGAAATFSATFYTINTAAAGDSSRALYHGFLYGDNIVAQEVRWNGSAFAGVMQSKLEVTRVDSLTQYGAVMVEGDAPVAGYDYVRRGNTVDPSRRGAIYLTSDDSNAPFIDIIDGLRYHSDWGSADVKRVRLGRLSGISDVDFGGPLDGYGLYANRAYIKGKIVVTGGNAATTEALAAGLGGKADTAYVDGGLGGKISLGFAAADINANTTLIEGGKIVTGSVTALQIAASAITGDKLALTSYLAINNATYGADGVQIQYNAGNPRAYIGNGSTRYFQFDGTNITWAGANTSLTAAGLFTATNAVIDGDITADTGYIGGTTGWVIGTGQISSSNVRLIAGTNARLEVGSGSNIAGINTVAASGEVAFWAGSAFASRTTAKTRIYADGTLITAGATVEGNIVVDGGYVRGTLLAGDGAVRFATDGQRLGLPNVTGISVPTSSSAIRWFPDVSGTHDYTKNYTGLVGYRHTGYSVVDMLHTVFVGSADAATYAARLILQAGHQTGSDAATTYTDCRLEVVREAGAGLRVINAYCNTLWVEGGLSALSIVDRTPHYAGDALGALRGVRGKGGKIDHSTLPAFARRQMRTPDGNTEEGRDLGAMISILVAAVGQLEQRLSALEGKGVSA